MRFFRQFQKKYNLSDRELWSVILLHLFIIIILGLGNTLPQLLKPTAIKLGIIEEITISPELLALQKEWEKDSLFTFNPNKANALQLHQLGFKKKSIQHLLNFRKKGYNFRLKKDLLKIADMDSLHFQKIYTFIDLPESFPKRNPKAKAKPKMAKPYSPPKKLNINLNTADKHNLSKIYGIGPKRAEQILKYRKLLGGYVEKEQLAEVYALEGETEVLKNCYQACFITPHFQPETISINQDDFKKLVRHPYLEYEEVKVICNYRREFPIENSSHLKKILSCSDRKIQKLAPYLNFD
ncbi:ComEA family DNA-binding protein [Persicobacter diffluens]|uniref:Uncharacterized protein n=1 Tax=Persicobacter diffluens TaxID=981 RepID=A0AAN4VVM1_9BACT|nr:hypothetical protein PEDI_01920 [Persicobacter diffluens]